MKGGGGAGRGGLPRLWILAAGLILLALCPFMLATPGGASARPGGGSPGPGVEPGWTRLGPGGGGALYTPTVKPGDPDTALVSSDMTPTFITRDGGRSWRMMKFNATTTSIAFDPIVTSTIYAGTEAGNIFRSVDDGERWELIYPPAATVVGENHVGDHGDYEILSTDKGWIGYRYAITSIVVDPDRRRCLFMAAGVLSAVTVDVMRSCDGGGTWSKITTLPGSTRFGSFVDMYVDPASSADDRRLVAFTTDEAALIDVETGAIRLIKPPRAEGLTDSSVGIDPGSGALVLYATSGVTYNSATSGVFETGAFRSFDMGETWEEMTGGLDAGYVPGTDLTYSRVATCPTDASVVYMASLETEGGRFGIMKSTDAGVTWSWALDVTRPSNKALGWVERDYPPGWAGAPFAMRVADEAPDVVYATDWATIYRTTDGGETWDELYTDPRPDGTYRSRGVDVTTSDTIVFDPFDHAHQALVNSSDIGLFVSHNGGETWKHSLGGVPARWRNACYGLVFDPAIRGKAWSVWSGVHDLPRYRYIRQPYDVEAGAGGVCLSTDGLGSWQCSTSGLPARSVPTSVVMDPASRAGQRTLYVAVMGRGVYRSTDDGRTWVQKNRGIEGNGLNEHIYAWSVARAPDGALFLLVARSARQGTTSRTANLDVATAGAVYRSTDGAESWQRLTLPEGVVFPSNMAFDPSNPRRAYLAAWPQTMEPEHVDRHGGLYRTEDGGETWALVFDDTAHVYGVTVDPTHTDRVFITSFEGDVLRSDDRGEAWRRLGGFNFKMPKNPIIHPGEGGEMIYVTTLGGGLWHGPQAGVPGFQEDVLPFLRGMARPQRP